MRIELSGLIEFEGVDCATGQEQNGRGRQRRKEMQEIELLITNDFFTKNSIQFVQYLKELLKDPNAKIQSRNWNLDALLMSSIGFNFSSMDKDHQTAG